MPLEVVTDFNVQTRTFHEKLEDIRQVRRRRRRRRLAIAVAIPLVLLLATGTFVLTQRNVTTSVSLERATAEFRAKRSTAPERPNAATSIAEQAPEPEQTDGPAPASTKAGAVESKDTTFASLPAEGIYAYRASGGEKISVFGASHEYPERIFATVRHLGGCRWEHRNDVIEEHVDRREMCNQTGQLLQLEQSREVEFFGKRDGGSMRCDPPALQHAAQDAPGATSAATCVDEETEDRATARRTFIGLRPITIDGTTIDAVHYRVDSTFTGHATGSSVDTYWVLPQTGMTLRWDRTVATMADATFGARVRYEEEASFVLESLTPRT